MIPFKGRSCPLCGNAFGENDDIVVCPECGTAHHRSCYGKNGRCSNEEKHSHGSGREKDSADCAAFSPAGEEDSGGMICRRCKYANPADADFCVRCGLSLKNDQSGLRSAAVSPVSSGFPDPYGGVRPDETIDGIPASELVYLVGPNSSYYLPKFSSMSRSRNPFSVNWSGLILGSYWLAYRKIYPAAAILTALAALFSAPVELILNNQLQTGVQERVSAFISSVPGFVFPLLCVGIVLVHFVTGFFGNYIYMKHCVKKVRKISRQRNGVERIEFLKALTLDGSVSLNRAFVFYLLSVLLQWLINYALLFAFK
ncbi:MAG: DUF2628 domain-containing protein [Clostridia bacterium]|nr:DUF2628 domain-containing protein [Clostridia bacterium]